MSNKPDKKGSIVHNIKFDNFTDKKGDVKIKQRNPNEKKRLSNTNDGGPVKEEEMREKSAGSKY